jgi:hypothetical protein
MRHLPLTALCAALTSAAAAQNLVVNGDFSAGNTGFVTDYAFASNNTTEGQYTVSANPAGFNGAFTNPPNATLMMVVNGATSPGLRVWVQSVAVAPGVTYHLSLRGFTAVSGGPAILQFSINGSAVGPALTLPQSPSGGWATLDADWTASGNAAQIVLDDVNTSRFPNDFYIDDIAMISTPQCDFPDFNCDGDVGTDADIEDFFACIAGSCPPPPCASTADFNGDGDIGTDADIESFFRVLAGGPC